VTVEQWRFGALFEDAFRKFVALLDMPPKENPRLRILAAFEGSPRCFL
jgi:uncharacterized protein (DUF1778 family)